MFFGIFGVFLFFGLLFDFLCKNRKTTGAAAISKENSRENTGTNGKNESDIGSGDDGDFDSVIAKNTDVDDDEVGPNEKLQGGHNRDGTVTTTEPYTEQDQQAAMNLLSSLAGISDSSDDENEGQGEKRRAHARDIAGSQGL